MVEDRADTRDFSWRHLFPWTELFRGFSVARGFSKLLLAAAGLLTMAVLWWVLAFLFFYPQRTPPEWPGDYKSRAYGADEAQRQANGWKDFHRDRENWNLLHETAGYGPDHYDAGDLAQDPADFEQIDKYVKDGRKAPDNDDRIQALMHHLERQTKVPPDEIKQLALLLPGTAPGSNQAEQDAKTQDNERLVKAWIINDPNITKPYGTLSTLPWFEDRGPNPFLLVTGQAGIPWETGHFWDWILTKQAPVLLEPLVKFLRPVIYFFSPRATWLTRLYFLLDILVVLATWAFFGGAITRMAAVEVARNEKISALEAMRFVGKRYLSFLSAPIIPLILVAGLIVILIIFGALHMIPVFGDIIVDGLFWWIPLILGLFMAFLLVCLVSWPLMTATVSAEDEEGLNAFARAYSYIIQAPWHYLWYAVVGLAYGAVVIFFVGFMASFMVYLASWGVGQTPGIGWADRRPTFLFIDAPTSFGWRALLLEGAGGEKGQPVVRNGEIIPENYNEYVSHLATWNYIGAWLVAIWLGALFLLLLGFGYSYFWTASTIIYLLMRRRVDDAELDEVYFEEEEQEEYAPLPSADKSAAPPPAPAPGMTMVEPPALRITTPAAPAAPPPPAGPAAVAPSPVERNTGAEARPATAVTPPPSQAEEPKPDGDANRNPPPVGGAPL